VVDKRGLEEIDADLPGDGYDRKKDVLEKLNEKIDALGKAIQEADREIADLSGEIRGTLGRLPDDIRRLEEEISGLERELEDKMLDKKAAALACEMFRDIGGDAGIQFEALKTDIMDMLSVIVPEERDVDVKSLNVDELRMKDAGGQYRDAEMLSDGTRDAFVFAARLAMAKKASPEARLLVLDEPFLHFDSGRTENSVRLLNHSFFREGWQIILLTKDGWIKELVAQEFGESAKVYDLEIGQGG